MEGKVRSRYKITMEIATAMRNEYNNTNVSCKEIAKKYNVSREYVNGIVANKSYCDENYVRTRINRPSLLVVREIRDQYNNKNVSCQELAQKYGLTKHCVEEVVANRRYYDENYVRTLPDRRIKVTPLIAKQIRTEYNDNKVSFLKLRQKYDVSEATITKVITNRAHIDPNYKRTRFTY